MAYRLEEYSERFVGGHLFADDLSVNGLVVEHNIESDDYWQGPTVAIMDGGGVQLNLGSGVASSPEGYAALTFGGVLPFPVNQIVRVEFDMMASGLTVNTQVLVGVAGVLEEDNADITHGAWITAEITQENSVETTVKYVVETRDGTHDLAVATPVSIAEDDWQLVKIEFSRGMADVQFHVEDNGVLRRVATHKTFNVAGSSSDNLQFVAKVQSLDTDEDPLLMLRNLRITYRSS